MTSPKEKAAWLSLAVGLGLAVESAIARLIPNTVTSPSEAAIICAVLSFSAAAFGISVYESRYREYR